MTCEPVVDGQELPGRAAGHGCSIASLTFVIQLLVAVALATDGAEESFHGWVVDVEAASAWRSGGGGEEGLDGCPVEGSDDIEEEVVFGVGDDDAP
jgi:hypothetical protein